MSWSASIDVGDMLQRFWSRHAFVDASVPEFPRQTVPYLIHGDEGRGQCKRPVLVVSFQPILGWSGEDHINSSKYVAYNSAFFLVGVDFEAWGKTFNEPHIHAISILHAVWRHTYTTRMLYTVLPSENYAPDGSTQHGLLQSLVEDCNRLFTSGFEARRFKFDRSL